MLYFAALNNQDGCVFCCDKSCEGIPTPAPVFDAEGRRVFEAMTGQVVIVVEGAPGNSGADAGSGVLPGPDGRTDVQAESTRDMGNGSAQVCDTGPPSQGGGGVPGIDPPRFDEDDPMITAALNDFACRFQPFSSSLPCTILDKSREAKTISPDATVQFCDFVAKAAALPPGDSILTVKLRDILGNLGPTAQIVVRVATLTPTPIPTATPTPWS